jgi:hypothetical protein
MNPNWNRWIKASINDYFKGAETATFKMIIENERPRDFENLKIPVYEVRILGPIFQVATRDEWYASVGVDVLIQCPVQVAQSVDLYHVHTLSGIIAAKATTIPLFSYGEQVPAHLGCLNRDGSPIRITDYGKQGTAERILHTTVEFGYEVELAEGN